MMKRLIPILILFSAFALPLYAVRNANAADIVDAGAGAGAGSGSAAGSAVAATNVTVIVPDPAVDPLGDASAAYKLFHSGAYIPALIVAAFAVLTLLAKYIKALQSGKTAAYVAAGIGFLAALIQSASQGQTPSLSVVMAALGAALALLIHPVADPTKAA